jgi:hypothetical protein
MNPSRLRRHLLASASHLTIHRAWIERTNSNTVNGRSQRDQNAGETERRPAARAACGKAATAAARGSQ